MLLAIRRRRRNRSRVCTAYEIGTKAPRIPAGLRHPAAEFLRFLGATRIVRPTLLAPVFLPDGEIREMCWGFRRQFKGAKGKPIRRTVVNAREDKLGSGMWREAFRERRCLIPATAFYEWVAGPQGTAVPLRFTRPDDEWQWIAGIWEEGETGPCYSMLTTEPSACVRDVHDRMPAVLADERILPYLDGDVDEIGPSPVPLRHAAAANFLRPPGRRKPADDQQSLF